MSNETHIPFCDPSAFSSTEIRFLSVTPKIVSCLSLASSGIILLIILGDSGRKERLTRITNRIVVMMSFINIIVSVGIFMTDIVGNCHVQVFFVRLRIALPLYNSFLVFHYLLSIRFRMPESTISKRIEPCGHVICFLFPLSSAVCAMILGSQSGGVASSMVGNICWHSGKSNANLFNVITLIIPIMISFSIITSSMIIIYIHAQDNSNRNEENDSVVDETRQPPAEQIEATQAALYYLAFIMTWFFVIAGFFERVFKQDCSFPLRFLNVVLVPLQCLFIACIYTRPIIIQLRKYNPHKSWVWSVGVVLLTPRHILRYFTTPVNTPQHDVLSGISSITHTNFGGVDPGSEWCCIRLYITNKLISIFNAHEDCAIVLHLQKINLTS